MDVGTVTASDIEKFGRMDPRGLLPLKKVEPLYDELLAKFTLEELIDLVEQLPVDKMAAELALPRVPQGVSYGRAYLLGWLKNPSARAAPRAARYRHRVAATYCALAAQHGVSKILEEMLVLSTQRLALVRRAKALLEGAEAKQANLLHAALKRGGKDALREVTQHGGDTTAPGDKPAPTEGAAPA